MRRAALVLVCLTLLACSRGEPRPPGTPVPFRPLSETQNINFCVAPPEFDVAIVEEEWIDVFDRQTRCREEREVKLPEVRFGSELGIAAWWKIENVLGVGIETTSVTRRGSTVRIDARSAQPAAGTYAASGRGALESFVAIETWAGWNGRETYRFFLDGVEVGKVETSF